MLSFILELLSSKLCNLIDSMLMFCLLILSMFSTCSDSSLVLVQTFVLFNSNLSIFCETFALLACVILAVFFLQILLVYLQDFVDQHLTPKLIDLHFLTFQLCCLQPLPYHSGTGLLIQTVQLDLWWQCFPPLIGKTGSFEIHIW